ncbi:MAG: hypothetical protein ISR58_05035 [Anaerolineales bacterium]|nr:hypothetical protein [Anaerolineales bacterium]
MERFVRLVLLMQIFLLPLGRNPRGIISRANSTTVYTWQLVHWSDAQPLCLLEIDHEGLPTGVEIYTQCGAERYQDWLNTPPCTAASTGGDTSARANILPKEWSMRLSVPDLACWAMAMPIHVG